MCRETLELGVDVCILGPLEVYRDGVNVNALGRGERVLLCRLALAGDDGVPREQLVDELWDGAPPEGAASTLRVYLSRLRKVMGTALETDRSGCRLTLGDDGLDARRFAADAAHARRVLDAGDPESARQLARQALQLWRGAAVPEVAERSFAVGHVARLDEERLSTLECRVEADLACGRHKEVVGELASLTLTYPFRETLWGFRMLALYRCGRQGDALRIYANVRRLLREDLGLNPGPDLQQLEGAILAQLPSLRWTGPTRRGASINGTDASSLTLGADASRAWTTVGSHSCVGSRT